MKVSFAITTHNEGQYITALTKSLEKYILHTPNPTDYEIVILDDFSDDPETKEILQNLHFDVQWMYVKRKLDNDFASQKNYLNSLCTGEYICQLDADEMISEDLFWLITMLPFLEENSSVEIFHLPRINTIEGLTQSHIKKWGWHITDLPNTKQAVMWPDYQARLYKNLPDIKWSGHVHERLIGHQTFAVLPEEERYAIQHYKKIDRQEKQNEFYNTIQKNT